GGSAAGRAHGGGAGVHASVSVHLLPSFVALEEAGDAPLRLAQRRRPGREQVAPRIGELVAPPRRTGAGGQPLRPASPLLLESGQDAVEVPHVDRLAGELLDTLEQLVPVGGLLLEKEERRGLGEALDAGVDVPVAPAGAPPAARPSSPSASTCK